MVAMSLADGFWTGAGGAIIGAFVGAVVGLVGGFLIEWWRNKKKEREEQKRRAEELLDSARVVATAFRNAAGALRVATGSNGSLDSWPPDDDRRLQEALDRIRRHAPRILWTQIEPRAAVLERLRNHQRANHTMPSDEADELSKRFDALARDVDKAFP
jgi:hypothetical protein